MPPPRGTRGGEQPVNDDDDDAANVKHPRTNSGGERASALSTIGERGVGRGRSPFPTEEAGPLGPGDDCCADR